MASLISKALSEKSLKGKRRLGYSYGADGLLAKRAKTVYVQDDGGLWWPEGEPPTYYLTDGRGSILERVTSANRY